MITQSCLAQDHKRDKIGYQTIGLWLSDFQNIEHRTRETFGLLDIGSRVLRGLVGCSVA